jgi:chorismate synthase
MVKYRLGDARPISERASARETAARVAVGAVARQLLGRFGIAVGSYVAEIGGVVADPPELPHHELWAQAEASDLRCPDEEAAAKMRRRIDEAQEAGDSLGGVFVVTATGVPVGLGSHVHWDRRLDARLLWAVTSIPAIKGAEIGPAFQNVRRPGTQVHDEIHPDGEGDVTRRTNRAGGFEGGMTNGMPIVVRAAMKPIPTTVTPLRSVDLTTGQPSQTQYQRSDVCAVPAASVVGEAMVAWTLADALLDRLGGDSISEMENRHRDR